MPKKKQNTNLFSSLQHGPYLAVAIHAASPDDDEVAVNTVARKVSKRKKERSRIKLTGATLTRRVPNASDVVGGIRSEVEDTRGLSTQKAAVFGCADRVIDSVQVILHGSRQSHGISRSL